MRRTLMGKNTKTHQPEGSWHEGTEADKGGDDLGAVTLPAWCEDSLVAGK